MMQFVCENAVVLAIVAAFVSMTVTLGYALIEIGTRYTY